MSEKISFFFRFVDKLDKRYGGRVYFLKNAPPLSPDEQSLKAVVVVVCFRATND